MSTTSIPYNPVIFKIAVLVIVVVPLLATALAIKLLWDHAVHWSDLALLAIFYTLATVGVGTGYHRMVSHRSFQAHPAVKFVLLVLGSMSLQGNAVEWAATHIKHHALADREGDPHSPLDGFFHAHVGWLFGVGLNDADPQIYCRRLLTDRVVMFVGRTYWVWAGLGLLIPGLVGGWTGLLWGGLVRMALQHHATWSVNSVCHMFGRREFATTDQSRNEWVVGLLAFGEGWHNNHHAFPRSAYHGLHWWQFDLSGYLIRLLERLGLARDVYRVPPASRSRRAARLATPISDAARRIEQ
jgi:stearoyl-CoA desaturase (delta-9 desaturase)